MRTHTHRSATINIQTGNDAYRLFYISVSLRQSFVISDLEVLYSSDPTSTDKAMMHAVAALSTKSQVIRNTEWVSRAWHFCQLTNLTPSWEIIRLIRTGANYLRATSGCRCSIAPFCSTDIGPDPMINQVSTQRYPSYSATQTTSQPHRQRALRIISSDRICR